MKRYIKSFKTLEDKRDRTGGYKYVLKHGLGPGTIPRDADIIKIEDGDYYDIVYLDRPLTKEELKYYDIPAEWEIDRYIRSDNTTLYNDRYMAKQEDEDYKFAQRVYDEHPHLMEELRKR